MLACLALVFGLVLGEPVRATCDRVVVFTFDDASETVYTEAFPRMRERGLKGTLFLATSFVGSPGYVTWEQVEEMYRAGWEVGAHTHAHRDLTKLSVEEVQYELDTSDRILREHGYNPSSFAYPLGEFNLNVVLLVADRYDSARAGWGQYPSGVTADWPNSRFARVSFPLTLETRVEDIATMLEQQCGDVASAPLVLQFHQVEEGGGPWSVTPAFFKNLLASLDGQAGLAYPTFGELIANQHGGG